jgi:hypothetical protein
MRKQTDVSVKVDKNIPFPAAVRQGRRSRYPWHTMAKGESFAYDGNLDSAKSASTYYNIRTDKLFRARVLDNCVRVWRLK